MDDLLKGLPEAETIIEGVRHLSIGRHETLSALLVSIAAPRLRDLGLSVPPDDELPSDPELRLYALLGKDSSDPYVRYNALLARLVSFAQALERRVVNWRNPAPTWP